MAGEKSRQSYSFGGSGDRGDGLDPWTEGGLGGRLWAKSEQEQLKGKEQSQGGEVSDETVL